MRYFAVALNVALVIVVVAWLHSPPWDYRQTPRDEPNTISGKQKARANEQGAAWPRPIIPEGGPKKRDGESDSASKQRQHSSDEWSVGDKIAVIASFVALLQFGALLATWALMRGTARRQLRAYIAVDTSELRNLDGPEPVRAQVGLRNFGQTPAYTVKAWGGISYRPLPLKDALPSADHSGARPSFLAPQAFLDRMHGGTVLTAAQKVALQSGKAAIYVYGEVQYTDIFGRDQWVTYRFMFGGEAGVNIRKDAAGQTIGILGTCAQGNDASR